MGREFPNHHGGGALLSIHPFITISLFFATIAATIAVVLSLCGSLIRKKRPPPIPDDPETKDVNINPATCSPENTGMSSSPDQSPLVAVENGGSGEELPLPPGKRQMTGSVSFHFRSSSVASSSSVSSQLKKLSTSLSMRAIGITHKKNHHHHNQNQNQPQNQEENGVHKKEKKEKKLKHEDSIWKKTIILGEKCKVPDENDEDAIMYDEKGNRIQAYHRKTTSSSFGLSRQNSGIDRDAISSVVEQGINNETLRNALVGKTDQLH